MFEMSLGASGLGAMERIICILERGTLITKFYSRKKPENKFLTLRRETRQVGNICISLLLVVKLINLITYHIFWIKNV